MCKKLVCLLVVMSIAGSASALTFVGAADGSSWELVTVEGTQFSNWNADPSILTMPTTTDNASIQDGGVGASVQMSTSGNVCNKLQLTYTSGPPQLLTMNSGAGLTTAGSIEIYTGAGFASTVVVSAGATLTQNGGTVKLGRASRAGTHTLTVDGSASVQDMAIGTTSAGGGAGGTATLNVSGSVVINGSLGINADALDQICDIYITGDGEIQVTGWSEYLKAVGYVAAGGLIHGDGVDSGVDVVYNDMTGMGTISVPEPATIAMLGFGGLALIRKRR
jgi:hypothetical protein